MCAYFNKIYKLFTPVITYITLKIFSYYLKYYKNLYIKYYITFLLTLRIQYNNISYTVDANSHNFLNSTNIFLILPKTKYSAHTLHKSKTFGHPPERRRRRKKLRVSILFALGSIARALAREGANDAKNKSDYTMHLAGHEKESAPLWPRKESERASEKGKELYREGERNHYVTLRNITRCLQIARCTSSEASRTRIHIVIHTYIYIYIYIYVYEYVHEGTGVREREAEALLVRRRHLTRDLPQRDFLSLFLPLSFSSSHFFSSSSSTLPLSLSSSRWSL